MRLFLDCDKGRRLKDRYQCPEDAQDCIRAPALEKKVAVRGAPVVENPEMRWNHKTKTKHSFRGKCPILVKKRVGFGGTSESMIQDLSNRYRICENQCHPDWWKTKFREKSCNLSIRRQPYPLDPPPRFGEIRSWDIQNLGFLVILGDIYKGKSRRRRENFAILEVPKQRFLRGKRSKKGSQNGQNRGVH